MIVAGRVQGVVFREATRRRSAELSVRGWVRNRSDGCVEAVFEGSSRAVEEVLAFMHAGPPLAAVTGVEVIEEPPGDEFDSFRIR